MPAPDAATPNASAHERRGGGSAGRPSKRRAATRRKLVEAALDVFIEHSIRDAPVELICERAGFTRGAFYSNFASKEDLFLAVYEEHLTQHSVRLREIAADIFASTTVTDIETLRAAIARIAELFTAPLGSDEAWHVLNVEFRAQALRQPDLRDRANTVEQRFHAEMSQILVELLAQIGVRLVVEPRDAVLVLQAVYERGVERAYFEGSERAGDNHFVTTVLPRVMASLGELIEPAGRLPDADRPSL